MNFYIVTAFSFSISIAGVISAIRFRRISDAYDPFIYLVWIGLTNELLSYFIVHYGKSNALNNNLYYLIESLLLIFQFKKWKLYPTSNIAYYTLSTGIILFWIGENFLFGHIQEFASYFIIVHSLLIVLLSVQMINKLIAAQSKKLSRNSIFIISLGFIVYFTYAALVEAFYLYGLSASMLFRIYVTRILVFINLFTNILYALAVLWIPKKQKFSF